MTESQSGFPNTPDSVQYGQRFSYTICLILWARIFMSVFMDVLPPITVLLLGCILASLLAHIVGTYLYFEHWKA